MIHTAVVWMWDLLVSHLQVSLRVEVKLAVVSVVYIFTEDVKYIKCYELRQGWRLWVFLWSAFSLNVSGFESKELKSDYRCVKCIPILT